MSERQRKPADATLSASGTAPPAPADASFVPAEYEWLLMRFEADRQARAALLHERVQAARQGQKPLRVLDLGAGAGANLMYLAPRLSAPVQHWTLLDRDAGLVERVETCLDQLAPHLVSSEVALRRESERSIRVGANQIEYRAVVGNFLDPDDPIWDIRAQPWDLVVANAVFDLLSGPQFERFLSLAQQYWDPIRPPMYFTINLDHEFEFGPEADEDEAVRAMFHAHMKRPQPFGRALGADSASEMVAIAERLGWIVHQAPSPWRMSGSDTAMLHANLDFIAGAVRELIAGGDVRLSADGFQRWLELRRQQVDRGEFTLEVGHRDLLIDWPVEPAATAG